MSRSLITKRTSLAGISLALLASLLLASGILPLTMAQRQATEVERNVGTAVSLPQPTSCNLIQNGDFSAGINYNSGASGSMPPSSVSNWTQAFGSPQISPGPGCGGNPGFISMWGNKVVGEAVQQSGVPIQAGHTYKLSACVRWPNNNPTLPPYVRLNVRASNGPLATYTTPGAQIGVIGLPSNTPSIPAPGITSTQWTLVTLANWTAPNSYNTITLNPENNNTANNGNTVSWIQVDNVCLQDIRKPCPALDPNFTLNATLAGSSPTFTLNATSAPLPAGAGFWWQVEEIDSAGNAVAGTTMTNPSAWWSNPTATSFSGYCCNNASSPAGVFQQGHRYRITRGVWGPCNAWTAVSKTVFMCSNCRAPAIQTVPTTQQRPTLNDQ
jgi:hypothetical protein